MMMRHVSMNDFRADPESLVRAELDACERVLRSGWWILGKEVSAFEQVWVERTGARFAVGCGNGVDAIEIALRALSIGSGDEVITTPMTAFATVLAIIRAGATPVLADIDPDTAMLDPQSVERCVGPRTRAVVLVHLYGQVGPVLELNELATRHGLALIEDCAQAHGAMLAGIGAGNFGACAAWSFYPTKNLGAVGDAGALTTNSLEIAEAGRSLRNYGQSVRYHHPVIGMNSRLDELQAAILLARLPYLTEWTQRRRAIARRCAAEFKAPDVRVLPLPGDQHRHVHHLFVVTTPRRDELQTHLKKNEIDSLIHYPIPVHLQPPCRDISRDRSGLANAEEHARTCVSLPCHPAMTDEDIDAVIAAVNAF